MLCPQCQRPNADGARFCASCGALLASSDSDHPQPGQTMQAGQYRIVRQLGKGGMGAIYLAQNTQAFDRLCIIKEMIAYYEPGEEQGAQERFEQEARTLAGLKHPGIPDMYGFFGERGHNYIVMEYIQGQNLEHGLTRESSSGGQVAGAALKVEDGVRYAVEICRVLEYLAQVRPDPVVHCDIKPANIIVDQNSGQAVLVDFGTAQGPYWRDATHAGQAQPDARRASVYGTVGYAPPELYRGQAVPKSDVYSLAATLYHLITDDDPRGHPFKWPELERIPAPLARVLTRALENEANERLDAQQFRQQLEDLRAAQSAGTQVLTFPDGNIATTLTGFLDLSLRYWDHARQLLYDGTLDSWLRQNLRDPESAQRAQDATQEYPQTPDAGLDAFVRASNPRTVSPTLVIEPAAADLGSVLVGQACSADLRLRNMGPGGSHGSLRGSQPWLAVTPNQYALAPGASASLRVSVTADKALAGRRLAGEVVVTTSSGDRLTAPVGASVLRAGAATAAKATLRAGGASSATRTSKAGARRFFMGRAVVIVPVLLALLGVGIWRIATGPTTPGSRSLERGLGALRGQQWEQALRDLEDLQPDDAELAEVARLLDECMVAIPAGTLTMGSDTRTTEEWPAQPVVVRAFAMDRFEVTNAQYQRYVDEGHTAPGGWANGRYPRGKALLPVTGIAWQAARDYAQWAGKRLPTEAEWEWAARGAEARLYPWRGEASAARANTATGSGQQTKGQAARRVGSFPEGVSPEGVYDLIGNAREWTSDYYATYQVPHAPPSRGTAAIVKGGSWRTPLVVAFDRESEPLDRADDDLGLRCAR